MEILAIQWELCCCMPTPQLSVSCHTKFSSVLHLPGFCHTGGCKMLLWWLYCSSMLFTYLFCCCRLWPGLASPKVGCVLGLHPLWIYLVPSLRLHLLPLLIALGLEVLYKSIAADGMLEDTNLLPNVLRASDICALYQLLPWGMLPEWYIWAPPLVGDVADPTCKYLQVIGLFEISSTADQTVKFSSTDVSHLKVKVSYLNCQYFLESCSSRVTYNVDFRVQHLSLHLLWFCCVIPQVTDFGTIVVFVYLCCLMFKQGQLIWYLAKGYQ